MPFRETLLNLAITGVLVLIITLVAILMKESRPVPVAIPITKAAPQPSAGGLEMPVPRAEFEAFPKARLIESKNNEADTLRIKLDDTHDEMVFSLYVVDAADMTLTHPQRVQEQARWFLTTQEGVLKAGVEAAAFAAELLRKNPFTVITKWEPVPDRSRYYAFIQVRTPEKVLDLAEELMRRGYARTATVISVPPGDTRTPDDYSFHLFTLGKSAREAKLGAWAKK